MPNPILIAQPSPFRHTILTILGTGLALLLSLVVIRAQVIGFGWSALSSLWYLQRTLVSCYFDLIYAESLILGFLLLAVLLRRHGRMQLVVRWSFVGAALVSLVLGLVNIESAGLLGSPINYQWLYYSDFLTTVDANQAVADTMSFGLIAAGIAGLFGFMLLSKGLSVLLRRYLSRPLVGGSISILAVVGSSTFFVLAAPYLLGRADYHKFANAVYALAESLVLADQPSLTSIETPFGPEDFATVAERDSQAPSRMPAQAPAEIRNVILFVLESTPAEFVETYGGKYPVTPNLKRLSSQSLRFDKFYAHAPSTNKSMVSIISGVYPWISFRSLSRQYPDIPIPSIADVLKEDGYRTAIYHAANLRFQNMEAFIDGRGFDVMLDRRKIPMTEGSALSDDEQAAKAFVDWCTAKPDEKFFGLFWSRATHMPYYTKKKSGSFGEGNKEFTRYLNALKDGDAALGLVMDNLEASGLAESTLVIVIGDHGEAFFRHNQKGHACGVYEENVHIPLVMINSRLFHGGEDDTLGGTIDLAPTITEMLGLKPAGVWQGRSMFSEDRTDRVYFFAPWARKVFGMREKDQKFILNATDNRLEHYDLTVDPQELTDLHSPGSAQSETAKQRIAAWVQNQGRFMRKQIVAGRQKAQKVEQTKPK